MNKLTSANSRPVSVVFYKHTLRDFDAYVMAIPAIDADQHRPLEGRRLLDSDQGPKMQSLFIQVAQQLGVAVTDLPDAG